jgi:hypothetical protein
MLRSWVFIRLAQGLVDYPQDSSSRRYGYGTLVSLVGWGTMESRIRRACSMTYSRRVYGAKNSRSKNAICECHVPDRPLTRDET